MLLVGTSIASAYEFCDIKSSYGGGLVCPQSRPSLPGEMSGNGQRPDPLPNYSDLDLEQYGSTFTRLRFDLDIKQIDLLPPTENARLPYKRVDVMKFGVKSDSFLLGDPSLYRVLVMTLVRAYGSDWYTLEFSWRDPSAATPDVSNPTGEVNAALVQLVPAEKTITVQVEPLNGDGDWSNLGILVWASSNDLNAPSAGDATRHAVQLVYDKPEPFGMPDRPATLSFVRPADLRSGIVGGDLYRVGMTTNFMYYLPFDPPTDEPIDVPVYD